MKVRRIAIRHRPSYLMGLAFALLLSACQSQSNGFTSGDIPGVPVYPGAVQTTESTEISLSKDLTPGVVATERKRYLTDDSPEQVLAWYNEAVPEAGFDLGEPRVSDSLFFLTSEWRYGIYVVSDQGKTNIFILGGHE